MASKILLVEDDNNLREIYEARLQAEGYAILTAKDGEEALVIAKAEKPDLIISDVMMPRISGFEMLDILRNTDELKYTKVIMLTALGQAEDKTRANSLGADRYLVKSQVTLEDIVKSAHELTDNPNPSPAPVAAAATPSAYVTSAAPATPIVAAPAMPVQPTPSAVPMAPAPVPASLPPAAPPTFAQPPAATQFVPASPPTPTPFTAVPQPAQPQPPASEQSVPALPIPDPAPSPVPNTDTSLAPGGSPRPAYMTNFSAPPPAGPVPQPPALAVAAEPAPVPQLDNDQLNLATTAEEQATVNAQIASFADQPTSDRTQPTNGLSGAPNVPANGDDAALADAVDNLATSTEQTPTAAPTEPAITKPHAVAPTTPAAPEEKAAGNGSVVIANKKSIQPLEREPRPGLDELLAREEKKNITTAGYGQTMTAPTPEMTNGAMDDIDRPSGLAPRPGSAYAPSTSPKPEQPETPRLSNDLNDPNNIAL